MNDDRLARLLSYLAETPDNPRLIEDIAREAAATARFGQALQALQRLRELGATLSPELTAIEVRSLLQDGRMDDAVATAAMSRRHWPDHDMVKAEGAWALHCAGRHEEALEWLGGSPIQDEAQALLAQEVEVACKWQLGWLDAAWAACEAGLARWPDSARLLSCGSLLLHDLDRLREAIVLAQRAVASTSGGHTYEAFTVLSIQALHAHRLDEALVWADRALALRQDDGRNWMVRGAIHMAAQRHPQALADLRNAETLQPDDPEVCTALAWALCCDGQLDDAEAMAYRIIAASPAAGDAHATLAVVKALLGDMDAASRSADRAEALGMQGVELLYARALMQGGSPEQLAGVASGLAGQVGLDAQQHGVDVGTQRLG